MQDFMNLVMLICAALASMGFGVFVAYGLFKTGFALMRWHSQQNAPAAVEPAAEVARAS